MTLHADTDPIRRNSSRSGIISCMAAHTLLPAGTKTQRGARTLTLLTTTQASPNKHNIGTAAGKAQRIAHTQASA